MINGNLIKLGGIMSFVIDSVNKVISAPTAMVNEFKKTWNSLGWKSHPLGDQIYVNPHATEVDPSLGYEQGVIAKGFEIVTNLWSNHGYHGTSLKALGDQVEKGRFDNRGTKLYFADEKTAAQYAHVKGRGEGVIVEVSSKGPSVMNELLGNVSKGAYRYFPAGNEVTIQRVYKVRTSPQEEPSVADLQARKRYDDDANASNAKRLWRATNAAFKVVSGP